MNETVKIYHVDDDQRYISHTKSLIDKLDFVQYLGFSNSAEEGLIQINKLLPDIVILDIEMPGKDGLWLANELKTSKSLIVFSTSHAEYALNAYNAYCLHYLLKPITLENLQEVIEKYLELKNVIFKTQNEQISEYINKFLQKAEVPKRIYINTHKEIVILDLDSIVYIAADGAYTRFYLLNGAEIVSGKTMKTYAEIVEKNPDFIKIHRSYIVNQSHLSTISKKKLDITFNFKNNMKVQIASFRKDDWMDKFLY